MPTGKNDTKIHDASLPQVNSYGVIPDLTDRQRIFRRAMDERWRRTPIAEATNNSEYAQMPAILVNPALRESPYGIAVPLGQLNISKEREPTPYAAMPSPPPIIIKVPKFKQNQYDNIKHATVKPVYDDAKKAAEIKNPQILFEEKIKKFNIEAANAKDKNAPKEVVKQLREKFNLIVKEAGSLRGQLKGNQVSLLLQLGGNQVQALERKHQIEKPKVVIKAPEGMAPPLPPRPKR